MPKKKRKAGKAAAGNVRLNAQNPPATQRKQTRYQEHVQLLTGLCDDSELFHTPDRRAYATFEHDGHCETWEITGKPGDFRDYITLAFFNDNGTAPDNKAVKDVENQLMTRAKFKGMERPVFVRVGEHDGDIYLDLCNSDWRAVRITPDGWSVVANPACKFVRAPGMLHLPEPVRGGSIHNLERFIHLQGNDRILYLTALTADFRYGKQFPITLITGEQDTGKTTLALVRRALVDPSKAPVTNVPRNERDLYIACRNSWLLAYDNQSRLDGDLSDVLSLLATGGAFRTRQLWSDQREVIFEAMRPIIFTSIEDLATRSDFLRRTIHVRTIPLSPAERMGRELLDEFVEARPRILGAVLDVVCAAMKKLPTTRVEHLEGNPDFIKWGVAAEEALGFEPGAFLQAYQENRAEANRSALEACPITEPLFQVLRFNAAKGEVFQGTTKELLQNLARFRGQAKGWPQNERALTALLSRIAPNLRAEGVEIRKLGLDSRRRVQVLEIKLADSEAEKLRVTQARPKHKNFPECITWLRGLLEAGPKNLKGADGVLDLGHKAGFTRKLIELAGQELHIVAGPPAVPASKKQWALPERALAAVASASGVIVARPPAVEEEDWIDAMARGE